MKKLLLLVNCPAPGNIADSITVHWEKRDIAAGEFSLPVLMEAGLRQIRAEHMRWAFETGVEPQGNQSLAEAFECGATPSMWWTSLIYERHPKLSPDLYPIYKLRSLEMFLTEKKVDCVEVHGASRALEATLASLCKVLDIPFAAYRSGHEIERKGWRKKLYMWLPAPLRAIIRYMHWWWTIKRRLPARKNLNPYPGKEHSATIISYFPNIDLQAAGDGRFRSRYWEELHTALNERAKQERPDGPHFARWLFIRFPSPQLSFEQCLSLCGLFEEKGRDGLSFNYLEEFLTFGAQCKSILRWVRICCKSFFLQEKFREKCHFANSSMNFWLYQKEQWAESFRGWRCLERCLQNSAFTRYYSIAGPQRWNLFPLENCPWERMATEAARGIKTNGPVFGAQHSIIRPTDFRYFDSPQTFANKSCAIFQPDIFGANGASAMHQWLDAGMPAARLRQLEALRYQYLADERKNMPNAISSLPPQAGEPLEMPAARRLLVLTSFFGDETEAHLELLKKSLLSGILDEWQISIKPHPYLPVNDWLAGLPANIGRKIRIVSSPLAMILNDGVTVWASNSTTAALEAALKNLPLMVMAPVNDFDLCPIQNVPGLARTATPDDVRNHLENLLPPVLPHDYLDISPGLSEWKKLLGI